ncbi:uncharacterized protein LOC105214372 [Zeugodacus cucurbitae]|uniref:Cysteine--tRNA ligase n=1 Tax=Zeugodacus cucurbitae TaxID=28588 RepID=A0A0A1XGT8_ZEUCU|nr:uncharacterized protein LOC105214372 [Zeugodacus cucurbitae]
MAATTVVAIVVIGDCKYQHTQRFFDSREIPLKNHKYAMGQRSVLVMMLFAAYCYTICSAKLLEPIDYQGDLFLGVKSQQPHKRYQNSEPSELNAIQGKNENGDVFDELQADVYENLVRLVKEMQKDHERLSIRYKPNLGKRSQLYK